MLKTISISAIAVATIVGSAAAEGKLKSELDAFVVSLAEDGRETLTQTEEIFPGETVEYVLTYSNSTEVPLSGLVVTAPVPASTTFVAGSAKANTAAMFEVSIDEGQNWATPPLVRVLETGEQIVPASEYDLVRWVPDSAIAGDSEWQFAYRISVD